MNGIAWASEIGRARSSVGIGASLLTAAIMVTALKRGISPLPKPLGLAFAETVFGRPLPLPIGLLAHTGWVTAFTVVYVGLFRDGLTFPRALGLAFALWILVFLLFYPVVGWGFLGLAVTPKLIVASAVPHLFFAAFLWALCKAAFRETRSLGARSGRLGERA